MTTLVLLLVAAALAGVSIGCVGVGGVFLIPALVYIGGYDIHVAMATVTWSVFFTGIVGTVSFARHKSIDWRMAGWLSAGVSPAAFLGARTNAILSSHVLEALLAVLIAGTALHVLVTPAPVDRPSVSFHAARLSLIGAAVGFGSALTGTGGALLLVPVLLLLRVPVITAVGVSQVIQLPTALAGSAGYAVYGDVLYLLGTVIAVVSMGGVWAGALIAHSLPRSVARRVVAVALMAAAVLIALK